MYMKDLFSFKEIYFFNKTPDMWMILFIGVRQGGAVWQQGGKAERKGRAQQGKSVELLFILGDLGHGNCRLL